MCVCEYKFVQVKESILIDKEDLMLILIATQTSKPFNGLTMDISGVPKEGEKIQPLQDPGSSPHVSLRKQRPLWS